MDNCPICLGFYRKHSKQHLCAVCFRALLGRVPGDDFLQRTSPFTFYAIVSRAVRIERFRQKKAKRVFAAACRGQYHAYREFLKRALSRADKAEAERDGYRAHVEMVELRNANLRADLDQAKAELVRRPAEAKVKELLHKGYQDCERKKADLRVKVAQLEQSRDAFAWEAEKVHRRSLLGLIADRVTYRVGKWGLNRRFDWERDARQRWDTERETMTKFDEGYYG